ncbi:hypothetical protein AYL99_00841 [Fonsecaea erecta]|uniref:G domain-containing protein n=1 Tax=Fonsecaea erecta TaxID=1367422 RepID=A0A178ZYJ6_9EURO|nr:hypothetical protein AYL99_00841 [Fonsecaea erecta]OAP64869.1 hypothetical protein AYL99_00841 [Fonsecaea erecta]
MIDPRSNVRNEPRPKDAVTTRPDISDLFDGRSPEQLEKGVQVGLQLMEELTRTLREASIQESPAAPSKTIIGVLGATGAGKSSLINAIVDEECFVPTSCMGACTAVVTEISYSRPGDSPYVAEVEFISRDDWRRTLEVLFQDLLNSSGQVFPECMNENSEAGIAYAQVKAVYPELTKEEMAKVPVDKLMEHENVACLGTKRDIESEDGTAFYKGLQHFVSSKNTIGVRDRDGREKKPREVGFWPLIRVVKLYVKAPVLATGAVIVDLPGMHDSNQARAAVARDYMKHCNALLIVAPITRAVDDKTAQTLLGTSFRRQLKMDGGLSSVTFICSKTDDISIAEAQHALRLEEELEHLCTEQRALKVKKGASQKQLEDLKHSKSDMILTLHSINDQLKIWERLQTELEEGKTVFKPEPKSKKRKVLIRSSSVERLVGASKTESGRDCPNDSDQRASTAQSGYATSNTGHYQGEALTHNEISKKIIESRTAMADGRREQHKIEKKILELRAQVQEVDKKFENISEKLYACCIAYRNERSRDAIRQDYAAGILELDQELAEEEDAASFDPEVRTRDYDEVARKLPVFCVSSRAYQKLKGRLPQDATPPGFKHIDETELPALQAHCVQMTAPARQAYCRKILSNIFHYLNSLRLWASNASQANNLTGLRSVQVAQMLKERLNNLKSTLEKACDAFVDSTHDRLETNFREAALSATALARAQADSIVRRWGLPVNGGGLHYSTYKAVVCRDGRFASSRGYLNFNEDLLEPLTSHLAAPWEFAFVIAMPEMLDEFSADVVHMFTTFHNDVESAAVGNGASAAAFEILKRQIRIYQEKLRDMANQAKLYINNLQRNYSRLFETQISEHMHDGYALCANESGMGAYQRMKGKMERYIQNKKMSMFDIIFNHVRAHIMQIPTALRKHLIWSVVNDILRSIQREYVGVIVTRKDEVQNRRLLYDKVLKNVDSVELGIKDAVSAEAAPTLEPQSPTQGHAGEAEPSLVAKQKPGEGRFTDDSEDECSGDF